METKNIGLDVKAPSAPCKDKKCPFHGDLKVRGRQLVGKVVSALAKNSATVMWDRKYYIPKYERYEVRRTKIIVHNPECLNAQKDEIVRIAECRPLSKTKSFVIIEKLGKLEKVTGIEEKPEDKHKTEEEKKDKKDKKGQKEHKDSNPKKKQEK